MLLARCRDQPPVVPQKVSEDLSVVGDACTLGIVLLSD